MFWTVVNELKSPEDAAVVGRAILEAQYLVTH